MLRLATLGNVGTADTAVTQEHPKSAPLTTKSREGRKRPTSCPRSLTVPPLEIISRAVCEEVDFALLFPALFSLELLLLGVCLLWFTKRQKTGRILVTVGTVLLALLSHGGVGNLLLAPLEHQSPAWQASASGNAALAGRQPQRVVVLRRGIFCRSAISDHGASQSNGGDASG